MTIPRYVDCPRCPSCKSPCGVPPEESRLPGTLQCAACGHRWQGNVAELAQAERAEKSWEGKQSRAARREELKQEAIRAQLARTRYELWLEETRRANEAAASDSSSSLSLAQSEVK